MRLIPILFVTLAAYTVSAEADEGPTVIFTCPLSAPGN